MRRDPRRAISRAEAQSIEDSVIAASEAGDPDRAWELLQPLLRAPQYQVDVAIRVVGIVEQRYLPIERALEALEAIADAHGENPALLGSLGEALEGARDIDDLNSGPPEHPLFFDVFERLAQIAEVSKGLETEAQVLKGLSTAGRMLARQQDEITERSYRRLIELDPENDARHYNYGLFLKTRGHFEEGVIANQRAVDLVDKAVDSYEWNLGICATGAGESKIALDTWKRMGQKTEMGRFGLPEGGYPQCKVRLAERPLAERGGDRDDPGLEETIWIERLSPCHGIVRSVLYQDLGVDYGDVVLFDGAPMTYHRYGDQEVPVFPHLATLVRNDYQFFDFAATQETEGQINDSSADLAEDAIVYSHTENFRAICNERWRNPDIDHEHHEREENRVVSGRIAAPGHMAPGDLLAQLDRAMAKRAPCHIFTPDLCAAAGLYDRETFERRRFEMLRRG